MDNYIADPYGHWEIQHEICINKNYKKFSELEEKFKDNDYALSILYLRYAEHNEGLNYIDRIGYLDKSLDLVKDYEYFDQQRAHIYKVYANIFLENKDKERYYKYADKYLDLIAYDIDFNNVYIENVISDKKWEFLERFIYLNNARVEETKENKFLLAKSLYNQNKELNKSLTLLAEVQNDISEKYMNELNAMMQDLITRKCEVNFDLTKNQVKEMVTLRIFETALDEFISYVENNLRKDYAKFNKEKGDYDWISEPEEKCKKDLKLFLDTKFKGQIKSLDEVSTGAGYIDLYITFKNDLEIIIELKMCGRGYTSTYAEKGINQLKHYLHSKQSKIGYLLVYDSRKRDFGEKVTSVLETQKYLIQTKFIDMRMDGYRIATSIGGTLTGRGGDIIIIDDPIKPEDAFNLTSRENLMDWYRSTLYSRLNNQNNGVIIVVMQRLHVDDLTGQLLKQEGWELLKFPLIAEQDEIYTLNNSFFERKNGELLNSKMWSEESVNKLRQTISDYHFQAQYQQNPVLPDGNIIKFEWLKYYPIEKLSYSPHCIFQSWDIAGTISEKSDYSVCITCAYFGDYIYILDVYRDKLEYVDLKNKVIAKQKEYSCLPENIVIENKNIGQALINDLKNNTNMSVSTCNPVDSKELRLLFQSPKIKNGELWIPEKSQWKKDFVDEVTSFPKSQHDDQVDALSQLLWFLESKKIYFKPQKDIPKVPTIEDFIINPKEFFRGIKYHGHYRKK